MSATMTEHDLYTLSKIAEMLPWRINGEPITRHTLYRWCRSTTNPLPHGRAGKRILVSAKALAEYLTSAGGPVIPQGLPEAELEERRAKMRAELRELGIG